MTPGAQEAGADSILTERDRSILILRLNRPEQLNALNDDMVHRYIDALDEADADDEVRAVVVTGVGRAFCAGFDLASGGGTFDTGDDPEHRDIGGILNLRIFAMTKPVIAAINGPAVGLGATQTLPMDIRIASDTLKMGFVFSRRGIVADSCASWFLPRVVGVSRALEWTIGGRLFNAAEALATGLVRDMVPADRVLPTALELARELVDNTAAVSVALNRQLMWQMLGADHPIEANQVESRALRAVGGGADAQEGVQSFLQKRPARYPGRVPRDLPDFYPWWTERPFQPLP